METIKVNAGFLLGPLVGAVIGYITNGIAIKMLFRPLKPIYIGGRQLPFTPGIIPKEKARIAKSIGGMVTRELLNEEILTKALLREDIYHLLEEKVDAFLKEQEVNEDTVEETIEGIMGKERTVYLTCEAEEMLVECIYNRLLNLDLGHFVTERLVNILKEGGLSNLLGPMAMFVSDNMVESLAAKIEPAITAILEKEGEPLVRKAVEAESQKIKQETVGELAVKASKYNEAIKKAVVNIYKYLVTTQLKSALNHIGLAEMMEERINAYDNEELEKLILELMDKELKAIIWLGALLGAILGCIMSFV